LGFIADYIAEIFHNELRPLTFTDAYERHFAFGKSLGHRDRKAVMRTVSGLIKLVHPDGEVSKKELQEYLLFALEMRQRVKQQLRRINPTEFPNAELSFRDKSTGDDFFAECREMTVVDASHAVSSQEAAPSSTGKESIASPIEVFHGYELLDSLKAGGMAEAYRARKQTGNGDVFLKRVRKNSTDKIALEREMRIYEKLLRLNTRGVLQVLDFLRDDDYVALVTEFADGGDLGTWVENQGGGRGIGVAQAKEIGLAIASAIKELHENDIVHRDLKPQNVLRFHDRWKLADFGISKNLGRAITQRTFQQYGTLGYAAPEQFQGVEARPSADIYSLGKILVFLLSGQTDVDHVTYPAWRELVLACIRHDPVERPVIEDALKKLTDIPV
jgi:tRNA A-37 threonylcarbamoyl transferase component Bud32